jgi:hypothetical protein
MFFFKFAELFASQGAPLVSLTAKLPLVSTTPAANLPLVSMIPAANLPTVSTTTVANCHRCQRHRLQICHRCQWHRWQIMGSGCRHLKVYLKAKINIQYMLTLLPKGVQIKLLKIFLLEDFFHLPPMSTTLVVRISPQIFEKIRNGRNGILRCSVETHSWKKPEVENLETLSL